MRERYTPNELAAATDWLLRLRDNFFYHDEEKDIRNAINIALTAIGQLPDWNPPKERKLNGNYCGNCRYWTNTWKTSKGKVPCGGMCALGYPKNKHYTDKNGNTFKVCGWKLRTDHCKNWKGKENDV